VGRWSCCLIVRREWACHLVQCACYANVYTRERQIQRSNAVEFAMSEMGMHTHAGHRLACLSLSSSSVHSTRLRSYIRYYSTWYSVCKVLPRINPPTKIYILAVSCLEQQEGLRSLRGGLRYRRPKTKGELKWNARDSERWRKRSFGTSRKPSDDESNAVDQSPRSKGDRRSRTEVETDP